MAQFTAIKGKKIPNELYSEGENFSTIISTNCTMVAIVAMNMIKDRKLKSDLSEQVATDILWTLLAIENWEKLVLDCTWSQSEYKIKIIELAEIALLESEKAWN